MDNAESSTVDTAHECTICLQSYLADEGLLICKHSFCYTCIEAWSKQENTCPLCKVRFSYIERVSKQPTIGNKRKAPKNKRTRVKKKSQSDSRNAVIGGAAQHAHYLAMLQHYMAAQIMAEDDDDDESEDEDYAIGDMVPSFEDIFARHVIRRMNNSSTSPQQHAFAQTIPRNAIGNSSINPINLMDDDDDPPLLFRNGTSSSSSNSSSSRPPPLIDLCNESEDQTSSSSVDTSAIDLTQTSTLRHSITHNPYHYGHGYIALTDDDEDNEDEDDEEEEEECTCGNCRTRLPSIQQQLATSSTATTSATSSNAPSRTSGALVTSSRPNSRGVTNVIRRLVTAPLTSTTTSASRSMRSVPIRPNLQVLRRSKSHQQPK